MQRFILEMMHQYGYLGIYLLLLIESVFPPLPSEVILLFSGALTVTASLNIGQTIIIATAGSLSGAIVLYLFGSLFGAARVKKMLSGKTGKVLRLKPEAVDTAVRWFEQYQENAVIFGRCIPVIRSLISVPAGFTAMNVPRFILLTTLGSAVWNTLLICIGAALGKAPCRTLKNFPWPHSLLLLQFFCFIWNTGGGKSGRTGPRIHKRFCCYRLNFSSRRGSLTLHTNGLNNYGRCIKIRA